MSWTCVHCHTSFRTPMAAHWGKRQCWRHGPERRGQDESRLQCCGMAATGHVRPAINRGCTRVDHVPATLWNLRRLNDDTVLVPWFNLSASALIVTAQDIIIVPAIIPDTPKKKQPAIEEKEVLWRESLIQASRLEPTYFNSLNSTVQTTAKRQTTQRYALEEATRNQPQRSLTWLPAQPPPEAPAPNTLPRKGLLTNTFPNAVVNKNAEEEEDESDLLVDYQWLAPLVCISSTAHHSMRQTPTRQEEALAAELKSLQQIPALGRLRLTNPVAEAAIVREILQGSESSSSSSSFFG